ncbi:interferon alpha/beta receptor 2-like isoform X1, partial [Lates japonicus]
AFFCQVRFPLSGLKGEPGWMDATSGYYFTAKMTLTVVYFPGYRLGLTGSLWTASLPWNHGGPDPLQTQDQTIVQTGGPLPRVLTSSHHIEGVLVITPSSTSLSSLLIVKPALPSSGEKRSNQSLSDESDGESGTETTSGNKGYKLRSFSSPSLYFLLLWRKNSWRPVVSCLDLTAGQICNLTRVFKDPYSHYKARVQAFTPTQKSSWTVSGWFKPLSDTVLGPPDVSVSGCGNCLILQLRVPATSGLQRDLQLKDLYKEAILHVKRTRDGAEFSLNLPYSEENVITYLQPGVEYCVTVSVTGLFNSNPVPSKPYCAFTSPPPPRSSLYVVFGLLGAFSLLGFLFIGLVVYGGQLSFKLLRQPSGN